MAKRMRVQRSLQRVPGRRSGIGVAVSLLTGAAQAADPAALQDGGALAEVVVTALRRATSVQEVPYNISAVSGEALSTLGVTDVIDLARVIPGLAVVGSGSRQYNPTIIRGLSLDPLENSDALPNSTVAIYINNTPALVQPKIIDVKRIEILRGPQGTLYGSGSLGGALRYIVNDPILTRLEGSAAVKGYRIANSGKDSYDVEGVINIPLIANRAALRIAAAYLDDSGFTNYPFILAQSPVPPVFGTAQNPGAPAGLFPAQIPFRNQKNVDEEKHLTSRISLLVQLNDNFSAVGSVYYEDINVGGRTGSNSLSGRYALAERFAEPEYRRNTLAALELKYDLSFASLESSTSYGKRDESWIQDQTDLLITNINPSYANYPDFRVYAQDHRRFSSWVEEIRLVSQTKGPIDYVGGLYYTSEKSPSTSQEIVPGYPEYTMTTASPMPRPDHVEYYDRATAAAKEAAVYGELTYHLTSAWQATAGARYFDVRQDTENCFATPFFPYTGPTGFSFQCASGSSKSRKSIFKLNTSYDVAPGVMVYGTFSQGFRRGGPNNVPSYGQIQLAPSERSFQPDTVDNYELGLRSQWWDRRLTLNAAAYDIEWKDVQLAGLSQAGSIPITLNAASARSRGVELESRWTSTQRSSLSLSYAYVHALLSADFQQHDGAGVPFGDAYRKGTRLPGSPQHQVALSGDYRAGEWSWGGVTLHGDVSYSSSITTFPVVTSPDYRVLGGYSLLNAAVIVNQGPWEVRVFGSNLADKYAYVGQRGPAAYGAQGQFVLINRPRILGLRIAHKF